MSNGKDHTTLLKEAWGGLIDGINETPPFSWAVAMAGWAVDKLAALLERITHKEDNMIILKKEERCQDCVAVTAEEAAENISKVMEAMNGPTQAERVWEEFHQIFAEQVNRKGANELLEWMEKNGFFEAPASKGHHLAVPGGLALHSLHVYKRLLEITAREVFGGPEMDLLADYIKETVTILGLLHDVCKVGVYHKVTPFEAVMEKKTGLYTFKDPFPLGHGEKSLFLITRHMALTEEEALAIRWHMGAYDAAVKGGDCAMNEAMRLSPWVWRLQEADMCATYIDERSRDNGRA